LSEEEINEQAELEEKAQIIAEATGRTKEAVLEDLLDDGIVNLSNEEKKDASLVEQLKEAAELIATVQNINKQVSDNTVLNGGNNKTEVAVETTLEGDIVDRAIASVERKAEKIRKIALIMAPILLLATGGVGLDYFLEDGGDDDWDGDYYEIWGCTAPDAENYMPDATNDDGSCFWSNGGGGGGGPPDCMENWNWDMVDINDFDANGQGYNNDIKVRTDFNDWSRCNAHMDGYFIISVDNDETGENYDMHQINDKFHDEFFVDHHVYDVPAGEYRVSVSYHKGPNFWEGPSTLLTMEGEPEQCDDDIVVTELQLSANGNDLNLYAEFQDNNDCGAPIQMQLALYKNDQYQDYFIANNNYYVQDMGMTYFNINQDDNELMGDVEDGDWKVEFRWWIEGEEETCCDITNFVTVDEIPDTVPCDADIDNLQINVDEAAVTVTFYIAQQEDTDCDSWDVQIELLPEDTGIDSITHQQGISATSNYYSHTFEEIGNAVWKAKVTLIQAEQGIIAEEETDWVTVSYSDEPCDAEIINHYRGHVADDAEQDAIIVAFRVVPTSGCEGLEIDVELFQNGYEANYSTYFSIDGSEAEDFSYTFDGVAVGNSWIPRVTAYNIEDDSQVEQIMMWGIDVVAPEPEVCEINLFDIQLGTNSTHASVAYDLDCGTETNDLDGYNVTVQFLIYDINSSTSGAQPLIWTQTVHYIQGYADDVRYITLTNFTHDNITMYDIYWYATWTDGDGVQQTIEQKWLERELNP
tara:strand:+ start:10329 stop:12587 length:2259 start_codon:yes stop_codon:yes gene_type:complete